MSGSSLDGLDLALCYYQKDGNHWNYEILEGKTITFPDTLYQRLQNCRNLSGLELSLLDVDLGKWIGSECYKFIEDREVDVIGSHGHTVFHDSNQGYSVQIGNGYWIAQETGILTVNNFRMADIVKGGQGAPLVPIGDELLFHEFDGCLNLGGIANISYRTNESRVAWDICAFNQINNLLSDRLGKAYDDGGSIARSGSLNESWFEVLSKEPFYQLPAPKSISNEWVEDRIIKKIPEGKVADLLHTFSRFTSKLIGDVINEANLINVMIAGGGANNDFFIELLREQTHATQISLPKKELVDFKEAIVFGLMAVLRLSNENNILSSATGATSDVSAGIFHLPGQEN